MSVHVCHMQGSNPNVGKVNWQFENGSMLKLIVQNVWESRNQNIIPYSWKFLQWKIRSSSTYLLVYVPAWLAVVFGINTTSN